MLFVLLLTITHIVHADSVKATAPVAIILDGFTLESWNTQSVWNETRFSIVHHLNKLCKNDIYCNGEYDINHVHLLDIINCGLSSVCLNVTVDKIGNRSLYNYTALLTDALFQAKIDIEYMYDNQSTHSNQNLVVNRTTRFLLVLLGICIVGIVFALTIFFFQRVRQYHYSTLFKTTETCEQTQHESLNNAQSTSILH